MLSTAKVAIGGTIIATTVILFVEKTDPRETTPFKSMMDIGSKYILNNIDPEKAHDITIKLMHAGIYPINHFNYPSLHTKVFNLDFNTPIGMAAGFDKQGSIIKPLFKMGFSFIEVGGITPTPQEGNNKPRLFRLKEDHAIINRMGLNSDGVVKVTKKIQHAKKKKSKYQKNIAVNMAPNTNSQNVSGDYIILVEHLGPYADMLVMNVSCPNVGSFHQEVNEEMLELIKTVKLHVDQLGSKKPPLLVKIGPDLSHVALEKLSTLALDGYIDGFVISNTSSLRKGPPLKSQPYYAKEEGGISGDPIKPFALATLKHIYQLTEGTVPIIGVGGISSGQDAYERIKAGASLIQIYSAMVLDGPRCIEKIHEELTALVEKDGFESISEAVGVDNPILQQEDNQESNMVK